MRTLLLIIAAVAILAGFLAFLAPIQFFEWFASHTGLANTHLVRDVGAAYISVGVATYIAAQVADYRFPLLFVSAIFLSLHAIGHIIDHLTGLVGIAHLLIDAIQIFAPAILVSALTWISYKSK